MSSSGMIPFSRASKNPPLNDRAIEDRRGIRPPTPLFLCSPGRFSQGSSLITHRNPSSIQIYRSCGLQKAASDTILPPHLGCIILLENGFWMKWTSASNTPRRGSSALRVERQVTPADLCLYSSPFPPKEEALFATEC